MQVGPRTPVRIQLQKAEVGPTSGPTRRLSHLGLEPEALDEAGPVTRGLEAEHLEPAAVRGLVIIECRVRGGLDLGFGRIVASDIAVPTMLMNLV